MLKKLGRGFGKWLRRSVFRNLGRNARGISTVRSTGRTAKTMGRGAQQTMATTGRKIRLKKIRKKPEWRSAMRIRAPFLQQFQDGC